LKEGQGPSFVIVHLPTSEANAKRKLKNAGTIIATMDQNATKLAFQMGVVIIYVIVQADTRKNDTTPASSVSIPAQYFAQGTTILTVGNFAQTVAHARKRLMSPAHARQVFLGLVVPLQLTRMEANTLNAN